MKHCPIGRIRPVLLLALILCSGLRLPALTHTVQRGETLGTIAAQYGVNTASLARENRLGDADLVIVGQQLQIPSSASSFVEYRVRKGDSLGSIATRFGLSAKEISSANNLRDEDFLRVGQILRLPNRQYSGPNYTVQKGDSLASIAARHGVAVTDLAAANVLPNADLLKVGQILVIPGRSAPAGPSPVNASTAAAESPPPTSYTVESGDNLATIALRHDVSVAAIARANSLKNTNHLVVGQVLAIPAGSQPLAAYTVRKGESLGSIAARHRISVSDILALNPLSRPDRIVPGQVLLLPTDAVAPIAPPKPVYPMVPSSIQRQIDSVRVKAGQWKHIVIHHSGMPLGSGKNIDRYHREERHMENGLAYHFVIGNGNGMNDGEIFIGTRWKKQIEGGHLAIQTLNRNSIGICLIGNFEKDRPTARQLNSLEALIRTLLKDTGLPRSAVTTHKLIHPRHTLCPGRHFPTEAFEARLAK